MPKISKIAVLGARSVGKTALIHQIVYGNYTIEKVKMKYILKSANNKFLIIPSFFILILIIIILILKWHYRVNSNVALKMNAIVILYLNSYFDMICYYYCCTTLYYHYLFSKVMHPTISDSYDAWVDADRGQKERIRIYDLQGQVLYILVTWK